MRGERGEDALGRTPRGNPVGGEYSGAHARTVVLVEHLDDDVCRVHTVDGGGPGIHFAHLRMRVSASRELWFAADDRLDGATLRPLRGRRCWGITRADRYPLRRADTDPAPPPSS